MASHNRWGLAAGVAVLTAASIAATAATTATADSAPTGTLSVDRACYVNTARAAAKITITGTGWQSGATIELGDKLKKLSGTATVKADGTFLASLPAPVVDSYKQMQIADTIEAYYEGTPAVTSSTDSGTISSAPFETTNFAVLVTGKATSPATRRTFQLSGFTPNRTVYGHYVTKQGKLLKTVAFGKPTGVCGLRRLTAYEYPGGHPAKGSYTVQFDNSRAFSAKTTPSYRFSFEVLTV